MSIRATVRVTGAAKNTITKLLVELGRACAEYQDGALTDLPCTNLQCDEIWSFCYSKQKNVPEEHIGEFGYGERVDLDRVVRRYQAGGVVAHRVARCSRRRSIHAGLGIPPAQPCATDDRRPPCLPQCG
jgi:hypothetical protein